MYTVDAEYSEWNDIFVYALSALKPYSTEYQRIAAVVQAHMNRIEAFITELPDEVRPKLGQTEPIWQNHILVVDDDEGIRNFLEDLFTDIGYVHTAANGREALERCAEQYYNVVVSDLDMPVMNGIEFFNRARHVDSDFAERLLFFTANTEASTREIADKYNARYLAKPAGINSIRDIVVEIIHIHGVRNP
jgi:two-component system, chemotaxis family, chemotaxis protein CheY